MNSLISMTGKTAKKGSKPCRTKNTQDKHDILKEFLQEIGYDELCNLISELVDNGDEKLIDNLRKLLKIPNYLLEKWVGFWMFQNLKFVTFQIINFPILFNTKSNLLYEKIIDIFN